MFECGWFCERARISARSARTRKKHPPLVLAVNTLLARGFVFICTQENRRSVNNVYFRTDCQVCNCGYDGCIRDQPYLQAPACPYRDRDQRSFAVICHKSRLKLVKVTSRAARFAFKTSLFTVLLFLTEIVERAYESAGHKEKNVCGRANFILS